MKNYQKPQIDIRVLQINEEISSLAAWLEDAGAEYQDAGITTYVVVS